MRRRASDEKDPVGHRRRRGRPWHSRPRLHSPAPPHFISSAFSVSRSDSTLTVSGNEAGLGDEPQIHVVLSAIALCINGGGNHPKAVNKASVSAAGDFPVQNGKADFSLSVTAVFSPPCEPPMTVAFTDVTVTDTTNGLTATILGTF